MTLTLHELLIGNGGVDGASDKGKSVSKTPAVKFSIIKKSEQQGENQQQDAEPTAVTGNGLQSLFQQYGSDEDEWYQCIFFILPNKLCLKLWSKDQVAPEDYLKVQLASAWLFGSIGPLKTKIKSIKHFHPK